MGGPSPIPKRSTPDQADGAEVYAQRQPEYVTSWVYYLEELGWTENGEGNAPVVYVAMFTGAADRHEAEIRKRWSGPLCVVQRDVPSQAEAERLRAEAESALEAMGIQITLSSEGEPGQIAQFGVVADPGGRAQAAMDAEYGPGVVVLDPALQPVN